MITLPRHLASVLGLAWALAIGGVETYIPGLPGWAHYAIVAAGALLAAIGIPSPFQSPAAARVEAEAASQSNPPAGAQTWPT